MIVLSESHEAVIHSVDSARVNAAYLEMGDHKVFFLTHVDEMMELQVPKEVFTGPLFQMDNCVKYYGRVVGSYTTELDPKYNSKQLTTLRSTVKQGHIDSANAVKYFNDEAFVLRDADRRINKSYGGCLECLRNHNDIMANLDSLKNYILATNAPE
ncbi:MAG TPA: hypothetical protein DIT65_01305 [Cryomorphaceae bacterium]|nr:hypothetical protein [Cryomorphaceae bacterium]|tara:strand:+ start:744 stop:1211 length:468 start_codon:yes stop_codon:yes gene_type:complete